MKRFIAAVAVAASLFASPYIGQAAKVVVDPGHGGSDPGAVGINGLYEKSVNNEIAYRLRDILIEKGYEVVMTRNTDKTLSLQARVEIARAADADLFVSVHANAHPSKDVRGTMVLYHDAAKPNPDYPASDEMKALSPQSRHLAQLVLSSVLEQVPNTDRGLLQSSAYVVRMGNVPSVLVETAFLSNAQDAKLLSSSSIRAKYASGIANGILKFLPPTFSDIGKHWAKDSIIRLNEQGIADGYNGKFNPDQPLTRAELMAFAERAFGFAGAKSEVTLAEFDGSVTVTESVYDEEGSSDLPATGSPDTPAVPEETTPSFGDLPDWHWSYAVMKEAAKSGILRGYPDGTIRPDAPVSRAEVAVVLDRLIGASQAGGSPSSSFKDVTSKNWAYSSIMRLSGLGIVNGVAERMYGPDRNVTRAEMATMVDRQLSRGHLEE
ncbi:N-acetylmuramoyl-L-alanine amidase [Paenibacillus antri]|uniref:N-acetylmuramoyl-L-alanine amidase n=1 Tax=Paenibacillus antri TaxID=2582848 RepID=A0A5R9GJ65_9BACL|nr:N-acetylmuramoyl-L-alanine amidase [Paenibacillus antri]TLS53524.1 N-acetylmuramoyl-L-alanine amidase [Paenibacillus antri]